LDFRRHRDFFGHNWLCSDLIQLIHANQFFLPFFLSFFFFKLKEAFVGLF
jgi:hypothetical protein